MIWPDQPRGEAYLANGAAEVWIVQPKTRSMTVFRIDGAERVTGTHECESANVSVNVPDLLDP